MKALTLPAAWQPCPGIQAQREDLKAPLNLGQAGEVIQTADLVLSNRPGDGDEDREIIAVYGKVSANQVSGYETADSYQQKWSSAYSYDADGRITGITGTRPLGTGQSEQYTYNNGTEELNRLTQAVIDGSTFNYQYDPAGNLTSMTVPVFGTETYTYDADNRITTSGFSYDDNGNLTQAAMYGTSFNYVYDTLNRLITVKDSNNNVLASYTYDGEGNRVSKTAGGVTTDYHYFDGQLMYETVDSNITALYLRSADGKLLGVRLNQNGTDNYYYYHYDAQGDVTAVTDANGDLYRQYVYDPYGNIISEKDGGGNSVDIGNDSGFNNAYTYRGYRFDSESGLYFLQSRYYAAGIGQFLTKDTFNGNAINPSSLNLYSYCGGEPVNRIDPNGNAGFPLTFTPSLPLLAIPGAGEIVGAVLLIGATGYLGYTLYQASKNTLTNNPGKIANKLGRSVDEVKRAIEKVKQESSWRSGTKNRNPDIEVDTKTGEVYPKTPGGGIGDSIGNINDYLD